jgi:hypothetical protein
VVWWGACSRGRAGPVKFAVLEPGSPDAPSQCDKLLGQRTDHSVLGTRFARTRITALSKPGERYRYDVPAHLSKLSSVVRGTC